MAKLKIVLILLAVYIAYQYYDSFDPEEVRGKSVVITGASTGIGEQLAYHYSQLGAKVLITARREHVLQKVVAKCKELGAQDAHYIPLDMGKLEDTKRLIDAAKTKLGGIDHLILNHITNNYMALWKGDMEKLQRVMDINFRAYVSLATYATPMLNESNGRIAVVSSFAGKVATPFAALYSASKFALDGFFSALRQEFVMQNMDISVTLCIIGSIDTPNALEYSKTVYSGDLFYTTSADTASRIMKGATLREREVYFPWTMTRPTVMVRDLLPSVLEWMIKSSMKEDAVEKGRQ
ncbi:hydroxysteroid 11-beta-dehydrogenase 1-like protein isoform X1 [Amphiura filiformis]|uniref:hydroxysteroid 11-beta-dehydrogenase 1-like protein isoform X1 n=1 Tax=Amphiura filiformis TaxID=82378 RepID=UPI003B20CDE6